MIPLLLALVLLSGSALAQNTVHYTTTIENVKYLFATAQPVARLQPGDILDTYTLDCFGNALRKPGDKMSMVKGENPLAGPRFRGQCTNRHWELRCTFCPTYPS